MSPAIVTGQAPLLGHVLLSDDCVEGIVIIAHEPIVSWDNPDSWMTYVRYLATAPWNRDSANPETGFLGIGRLLVARAVLDSIAHGNDGRIGLHSLCSATPFYKSLGFKCLGADPVHRGLPRFELSPESAISPLAEIGTHLIHNLDIFDSTHSIMAGTAD